jgi:hypothetical protein
MQTAHCTAPTLTARLVYELFNNSALIFATNQYSSLAQAEPAELWQMPVFVKEPATYD